ncbi:hypothetical protein V8G54_034589, partial [Vigna mungo]
VWTAAATIPVTRNCRESPTSHSSLYLRRGFCSPVCSLLLTTELDLQQKPPAGQVKNFDEALDLFQRMARMKHVPSLKDFTLLLGVIVRLRHYTTAISLVKHMYSALDIEPDINTLNIVINCLCRLKLISFGFSVFARQHHHPFP